jgi:hypothetical protein
MLCHSDKNLNRVMYVFLDRTNCIFRFIVANCAQDVGKKVIFQHVKSSDRGDDTNAFGGQLFS